jgi:uncharacterized protein (DUF2147 family)
MNCMKMARYVRMAAAIAFAALVQSAGAAPAVTPAPAPAPVPQTGLEGTWLTDAKSEITISACPDEYCGNISKIVVPEDIYKQNKKAIDAIGATNFTDLMNKDATLRNRPILGLQILKLHAGNKPRIFDGEIYNPQDGNTYSGYVEVLGANKIRLNGCILYNIICKGEEWTRVIAPPPDATTPASGTTAAPAPAAAGAHPAAGSIQ